MKGAGTADHKASWRRWADESSVVGITT